jgi:hypothetical protein
MNVVCRFKTVVVRHHFKLERHELDDLMSPIEPETIIQLRRNEWWCTVEYKSRIRYRIHLLASRRVIRSPSRIKVS